MKRDEIIRMAREANILEPIDFLESNQWLSDTIRELERFAALVISHHDKANRPKPDASEREWLQQIAYQHGGIGDLCQTEFEFGAMVAAAERKAIEPIVFGLCISDNNAQEIVTAIRKRGQG